MGKKPPPRGLRHTQKSKVLEISRINQFVKRALGLGDAQKLGFGEQLNDFLVLTAQALQDQGVVVGGSAIVHLDLALQPVE